MNFFKLTLCSGMLAFGIAGFANAQSLSPQVLASGGDFALQGSVSLSWTIGEMAAVETYTTGANMLTQGFQQPEDTTTTTAVGSIRSLASGDDLRVYPNPVVNNAEPLKLEIRSANGGTFSASFVDIAGRALPVAASGRVAAGETATLEVPVQNLSAGVYMLQVQRSASEVVSFKIHVLK